jgi:hypothetical protein
MHRQLKSHLGHQTLLTTIEGALRRIQRGHLHPETWLVTYRVLLHKSCRSSIARSIMEIQRLYRDSIFLRFSVRRDAKREMEQWVLETRFTLARVRGVGLLKQRVLIGAPYGLIGAPFFDRGTVARVFFDRGTVTRAPCLG